MAMSLESGARVGLAEYLTALQAELSKSGVQADKDKSRFSVDEVTLDVDIFHTLTSSADSPSTAKPKFWVLGSASPDTEDSIDSPVYQTTQRLSLRLHPRPEAVDANETKEALAFSVLPPSRSTTKDR
jgi:hypothetical protein